MPPDFLTSKYRRWSKEQKTKVLAEYETLRLKEARNGVRGGIYKFLEKYGISWSHLNQWAKQLGR